PVGGALDPAADAEDGGDVVEGADEGACRGEAVEGALAGACDGELEGDLVGDAAGGNEIAVPEGDLAGDEEEVAGAFGGDVRRDWLRRGRKGKAEFEEAGFGGHGG